AVAAVALVARRVCLDGSGGYGAGALLARCGEAAAAEHHLRRYLAQDASDSRGANFILAKIGRAPAPERTSQTQVVGLYEERSSHWKGKGYRAHTLVLHAIERLCGSAGGLDVLDAGCGTGLMGDSLRRIARLLDGVDLSGAMLDIARQN